MLAGISDLSEGSHCLGNPVTPVELNAVKEKPQNTALGKFIYRKEVK